MTDPQTETGETPPRKRIAVACGRCRKRKIRCSGDPGNHQPCSNCKNAGAEVCQFLRVSSTETPMRNQFDYDLGSARVHASKHPGGSIPVPYSQALDSGDMMASYRASNMYRYGNGGASYYTNAAAGWSGGYPDDGVDYGLNCGSYPVLNQDPSQMVPYSWSSRGKQTASGSMYVDPETAFSAYGNTANLVHRPAPGVASNDAPGFSLSSFAAALPSSGADRLLPTPVSRTLSSSVASGSYRGDGLSGYGKSAAASGSVVASPTSPISPDAAGYASSSTAEGSPMTAYPLSGSHHRPSYASSADVYGVGSHTNESIFSAEERGIGTQGAAVDLTGYTYGDPTSNSLRRGSAASSGPATGSGVHSYVPSEGPHHHAAVAGSTAFEEASGSSSAAGCGGGGTHADAHRASVGSRR